MPRLLIKQRVFSWSDTYDIYNETGEPVYFVKADVFTLGHRIRIYDRYNNEVGVIQERLLHFMPTFDITVNGQPVGSVQQKFSFLKPKYELDYGGWRADGDFLEHRYTVYSSCSLAMEMHKEWLTWGDTYVLDIVNPQDELKGVILAIAIDAANCSRNK